MDKTNNTLCYVMDPATTCETAQHQLPTVLLMVSGRAGLSGHRVRQTVPMRGWRLEHAPALTPPLSMAENLVRGWNSRACRVSRGSTVQLTAAGVHGRTLTSVPQFHAQDAEVTGRSSGVVLTPGQCLVEHPVADAHGKSNRATTTNTARTRLTEDGASGQNGPNVTLKSPSRVELDAVNALLQLIRATTAQEMTAKKCCVTAALENRQQNRLKTATGTLRHLEVTVPMGQMSNVIWNKNSWQLTMDRQLETSEFPSMLTTDSS